MIIDITVSFLCFDAVQGGMCIFTNHNNCFHKNLTNKYTKTLEFWFETISRSKKYWNKCTTLDHSKTIKIVVSLLCIPYSPYTSVLVYDMYKYAKKSIRV